MKTEICGWEVEDVPLPYRVYRCNTEAHWVLKAAFSSMDKAGGWLHEIGIINGPKYVEAIFRVFEEKNGVFSDVTAAVISLGTAGVGRGE